MQTLVGYVINGHGAASQRFDICKRTLEKYGLSFPPLHLGTINIQLEKEYVTSKQGVVIPYQELDDIAKVHQENWEFIPVENINGKHMVGYILRTSTNIHGNKVLELVTEYIEPEARESSTMEIGVDG